MRLFPSILTIALLVTIVIAGCTSSHAQNANAAPKVRWDRPADTGAAIKAAGLPGLPSEGVVEHIHAHLDVVVDGASVAVPADLGIDYQNARISPVHTHDTTGIIHIESPVVTTFSLGELFAEWGVRLNARCIADLCAGGDRQQVVTVNGTPFTGDPSTIPFTSHGQIAIWSGKPGTQPPLPASYDFPAGY